MSTFLLRQCVHVSLLCFCERLFHCDYHDTISLGWILRRKKQNIKLQPLLLSVYYGVGKIKQMTGDNEIIQTVQINKSRQQLMMTSRQSVEIRIC